MSVYGRWYNIASGRYTLLFAININIINEFIATNFKKFIDKYILIFLIKIIRGKINIKVLII